MDVNFLPNCLIPCCLISGSRSKKGNCHFLRWTKSQPVLTLCWSTEPVWVKDGQFQGAPIACFLLSGYSRVLECLAVKIVSPFCNHCPAPLIQVRSFDNSNISILHYLLPIFLATVAANCNSYLPVYRWHPHKSPGLLPLIHCFMFLFHLW